MALTDSSPDLLIRSLGDKTIKTELCTPLNVFNDPAPNAWDNGTEGNYWSDYKSTPYFISDKNQDNHPLIAPMEFAPLELPSIQPPQEADPTLNPTPTEPTTFPTALAVACIAAVATASLGLLVYFRKNRR
jgi:hypothetical protein